MTIKIGVVGAGMMGQHHLRVCNMLQGIDLVAVLDTDKQRAEHAAKRYGCKAYTHLPELIGQVDAVIIAAPSSLHAEIGLFFLNHGIHCLIEKPLAITKQECQKLIKAAEESDAILLVGHIEHFNPSIQKLKQLLSTNHTIYAVEARRLSNATRIMDVDVVMDLMVHDIEIILSLVRQDIIKLSAHALQMTSDVDVGYVSSVLSFSGGAVASIIASKVTNNKVRQLGITTDRGYFSLDYSTQELLFYRSLPKELSLADGQSIERIPLHPTEPLILEIQNFIESIQKGVALGVSGTDALNALTVVWQIQKQLQKNLSVQKEYQ